MFTVLSVRDTSDKLHSSLCHIEGAAPVSLRPGGGRGGGAVDNEDLPSPLFLAASCCGSHVVCSLLPGAQQAVGHQPLPWATEVWPVILRGGRGGGGRGSTVAPPDGVAGGEHSDSVVPERRKRRIQQLTDFYIQCVSEVFHHVPPEQLWFSYGVELYWRDEEHSSSTSRTSTLTTRTS